MLRTVIYCTFLLILKIFFCFDRRSSGRRCHGDGPRVAGLPHRGGA